MTRVFWVQLVSKAQLGCQENLVHLGQVDFKEILDLWVMQGLLVVLEQGGNLVLRDQMEILVRMEIVDLLAHLDRR